MDNVRWLQCIEEQRKIRNRQACFMCLMMVLALIITGAGYGLLDSIGLL